MIILKSTYNKYIEREKRKRISLALDCLGKMFGGATSLAIDDVFEETSDEIEPDVATANAFVASKLLILFFFY